MRIVVKLLFLACFYTSVLNAQSGNPFDIVRVNDSIPKAIIIEEVLETQELTKLEGENPFTISHIPIRKNQYRQIEQLNVQSNRDVENIEITNTPLWVIVISLCILAFMLFSKRDHIPVLLRSLSNENYLKVIQFEQNGGKSMAYILGYILFLVNFTLYIYTIVKDIVKVEPVPALWLIFLLTLLFFVGKHAVIAVMSNIFDFTKEAQIYNFTLITIRNILAIFFLCINILMVFGPSFWAKSLAISGAFVFIIFLMSRFYKGLRIGRKYVDGNFLHFFLYFCAFELSPWIIVYKLIGG